MKGQPLAAAVAAVSVLVSLTSLVASPAYGQSCTPSENSGEEERSGASLTNPAGTTIVVSRRGERGLDATMSATNHGTVITCGEVEEYSDGARRTHAVTVDSESGDATGENSGRIEARGDGARGLYIYTNGQGGTARATNRGRIVTRGDIYDGTAHFGRPYLRTPDGILAESGGNAGDAVAVNQRNSANDPQSGVIEVHGTGARGMWVWTSGTGEARGINRGNIATHGDAFGGSSSYGSAAAGMAAQSSRGSATAINEEGATVRTHGDGAPGLYAGIYNNRGAATTRTARAENHGTVIVSGDSVLLPDDEQDNVRSLFAVGVEASADVGSATVLNTGNVTASGSYGIGLLAHDGNYYEGNPSGYVDVIVQMTDGSVVAGSQDNPATPEDESALGIGIFAVTERDDANVTVSGASTTVTAYGAITDDPNTEGLDERGVGIFAGSYEGDGDVMVEVSGGATVSAGTAVDISGSEDVALNLYESRLNGQVVLDGSLSSNSRFKIRGGIVDGDVTFFSGGNDVLTIENHGRITGDVHFGGGYTNDDGMDTIVFDVTGTDDQVSSIEGTITGVEEMYKRGSGTARVRDVMFSGSALTLEAGGLTLAGHVNLGADGTLTVHDESRLTIEVGDITKDAMDHGRITAGGGVIYEGLAAQDSPEMFMQIGVDAAENRDAIQTRLQQEGTRIDVLGQDTNVLKRSDADLQPVAAETALMMVGDDGTHQTIGTLSNDGTAVVQLCPEGQVGTPPNCTTPEPPMCPEGQVGTPPNCTTAPRRDDGDSSNAGAVLIGGGAAAALAVYLFDLFDSEEPALVEYEESWTGSRSTTSFAGVQSGHYREHRVRTGAVEQWTRAFAGDSSALAGGVEGTVQGVALGMDAKLPRGFSVGVSMMPELAVSARRGPALNFGANVEGGRYALHGGWRGDALFVDTNLSHGNYRMHSFMENPAAGGLLGGELNLTQDHAQGRAGLRLDLGRIRATPSVSLFSGSLRQGAHAARGAAVSAEVPGISQRYSGWRAKLDLAPSGWLDGPRALNWRPSLHLGTTRTHTKGPASLDVRQSDHEGVLSFASRAVVRGLPRTVHGIGASLVAARSDAWNFRMGYSGMVVDGEPVHAAVARLLIRF